MGILNWEQLKAAGTHYKRKGNKMLVFLPRVKGLKELHDVQLRKLASELGEKSLVFTPVGVSDDRFMITYAQDDDQTRIVTNDLFRDHGVDATWVQNKCVKFAFAGGRFVPAQ